MNFKIIVSIIIVVCAVGGIAAYTQFISVPELETQSFDGIKVNVPENEEFNKNNEGIYEGKDMNITPAKTKAELNSMIAELGSKDNIKSLNSSNLPNGTFAFQLEDESIELIVVNNDLTEGIRLNIKEEKLAEPMAQSVVFSDGLSVIENNETTENITNNMKENITQSTENQNNQENSNSKEKNDDGPDLSGKMTSSEARSIAQSYISNNGLNVQLSGPFEENGQWVFTMTENGQYARQLIVNMENKQIYIRD